MNQRKVETGDQMYGCDINAFVESIQNSVTYKLTGGSMVVASLMSDAQEQMIHHDFEGARQTLNRAKHILFKIMQGELVSIRQQH